jgi:hypothetical protein
MRKMVTGLGLAGCALAIGVHCSSSSSTSSSGGNPDDCGPGPYVKVTGNVNEVTTDGTPHPKEGVEATFFQCPDKKFTSDALGQVHFNLTKGALGAIRLENPDDIPEYLGEWGTSADFVGTVEIVPKIFQSVIAPDFTPDKAGIGFGIAYPEGTFDGGVPPGGPTDPCKRSEGVAFAIPGHPEAKVTYFTTDAIPQPDPNATATSTNGLAVVTNLPDGLVLTPTATKAGCTITGTHHGFTGRLTLVKGYFVLFQMQMTK